ncbi:MAG TPA: protein-L-isoaspartate(D-aspartate) O-methyltransferase [Gemmatimonadaceae bacterium]|nr:protein-L-isoaspartate(D-aspartate) O-methyltransferase [Gemmatimonadaceae bacterium]
MNQSALEFRGPRRRLVETLQERGIDDLAVLRAFERTPRHLFVPSGVAHRAYEDSALPIGSGQTISQPSVHARYLHEIGFRGTERVLEIGTGSGYQTVLLAHLAAQVFSMERIGALLDRARDAIRLSGVSNVSLLAGDGTLGWSAFAPYDAILVSAGAPSVPMPLADQLGEGGRLLIPIGTMQDQTLRVYTKRDGELTHRDLAAVRFVPLVGMHGWPA